MKDINLALFKNGVVLYSRKRKGSSETGDHFGQIKP